MNDYLAQIFGLDGRVAALTGAGGHLIGEMARALGRAGVRVAALDVDLASAERTAAAIRDAGGDAIALSVDVRRKADYERALAAVLAR
jgi:3-oxoacyl-[acyl-carrier protein] reductase